MENKTKTLVKLYCRIAITLVVVFGARKLADYLIEEAPSFRSLIESAFALVIGAGSVAFVFLPLIPKNAEHRRDLWGDDAEVDSDAPKADAAELPALGVGERTQGQVMLRLLEFTRLVLMLGWIAFAAAVLIVHDQDVELIATLPVLGAGFVESVIGLLRPDLLRARPNSSFQAVLSGVSLYRKALDSNRDRLRYCIVMGTVFVGALGLTVFRFWY
jgi:hypothetical protein